jgi:uncharacterized protein
MRLMLFQTIFRAQSTGGAGRSPHAKWEFTLSEDSTSEIHAHVILCRKDGSVRGGHLFDGEVWPTLELVLTESPHYLRRKFNPEIGLALLDV